MVVEGTSSLTVAKLKALCILNDLPTTGKKSVLVERLLEFGLARSEIGLSVKKVTKPKPSNKKEPEVVEEEFVMSLEDESTLTPEEDDSEVDEVLSEDIEFAEDDFIEAEILDADLIDESEFEKAAPIPRKSKGNGKPVTLLDIIRRPQVAAVLLTAMMLAAGGWWFINNQLDPFTGAPLKYGDEMKYSISEGEFIATEGFLDLVLDNIETEDDICKIRLEYSGMGQTSITEGGTDELSSQSSQDRLGAVSVRGGQGGDWLAVEATNSFSFDNPYFTVQRHLRSPIPGSTACSDTYASVTGSSELNSTSWTELREKSSIANQVQWSVTLEDAYQGNTMSYGVGSLFGGLETIAPGFALLSQPVEIKQLFGNDWIDNDATGSDLGWDWRVIGIEEIGNDPMWKITATHHDLEAYCLGSASMTLWVGKDSPWAAKQTVDVVISGSDSNREGCSTTSKLLGDYVLPDGELEIHHTFDRITLKRGDKLLDLGKNYDNRPQANEFQPSDNDLVNWGDSDTHLPDDSDKRGYNLEQSIQCLDYFSEITGATVALNDDGYIWRAIDERANDVTTWNVSWVAADNTAGWIKFSISGQASEENCNYLDKGAYDEEISHNRNSIPSVLNLSMLETRLMDNSRFPQLTGNDKFFTTAGDYHPETRVGYLVMVPDSGLNSIISNFVDSSSGATTVDMSREWDFEWSNHLSLVADASDGRLIGWNLIQGPL
jgi:hypothetical protein